MAHIHTKSSEKRVACGLRHPASLGATKKDVRTPGVRMATFHFREIMEISGGGPGYLIDPSLLSVMTSSQRKMKEGKKQCYMVL
ncbi:hypothetical protein NPIL_424831 [Nephila pilipes]|uniref:Uncharacterized protein n=1 Tax=Nephila pilipes TaxID=299642 RepID=A0A8X6USX9_NEPPI|nr:hypothetical protein NPIL_424831 [Nephila pilipes]